MPGIRHSVFVYGTLKKGYLNHPHLRTATRRGVFRTLERYPLVILAPWEMPSLYQRPGQGHVIIGEVYEVDPPTLAALDRLEWVGQAEGYFRERIDVCAVRGSSRTLPCWTYFKCGTSPELATGPWHRCYRASRYRNLASPLPGRPAPGPEA